MMEIVKTSDSAEVEVFQKVIEDVPGGLLFDKSELKATTQYVAKGTVVAIDEATRKANIVKTAELQADAIDSAVAYRIKKNHELVVGDYLAESVGAKAYDITAIDTSNADYDQVTLSTTLGVALTAGKVLFQAAGESATNTSAYKYTAAGIVKSTFKVGTNNGCSVVIRGSVFENRLPFVVSAAMKSALTDRIYFSQSF